MVPEGWGLGVPTNLRLVLLLAAERLLLPVAERVPLLALERVLVLAAWLRVVEQQLELWVGGQLPDGCAASAGEEVAAVWELGGFSLVQLLVQLVGLGCLWGLFEALVLG